MNIISKLIWRWQGRAKSSSEDIGVQYTALTKLGEAGNHKDLELLFEYLSHPKQTVRNAAARAIQKIIDKTQDQEKRALMQNKLVALFTDSNSLIERISLIEAMKPMDLALREQVLGPLVSGSENDVQYVIIKSLQETEDQDILDAMLEAADTSDLVLRRTALNSWYEGIANQLFEEILSYCTPRLHYLIRASYELQTDGEFLRRVLSYSNKKELPSPKAYPDFIIRYMTELLGQWDYDPDAYRSLHSLMVPAYFTFDEESGEGERPFVIL